MSLYFNLFKCGKNTLNRIDTTCKQACMSTSSDRYYKEIFKTLTDYNDRNNTPIANGDIQEAICKVIKEE